MVESRKHPVFGRRFARHLWRLTRTYWRSADARKGAALLAGAIALELGAVYGNLWLSDAERGFMDALQDRQPAAFLTSMGIFAAVSAAVVLIAAYRIYLRQLVEIRWRRGVTADYVDRWMNKCAYGVVQLHRGQVDNPDQRIAEDVREFVASAIGVEVRSHREFGATPQSASKRLPALARMARDNATGSGAMRKSVSS